jgi:hypothetical protein
VGVVGSGESPDNHAEMTTGQPMDDAQPANPAQALASVRYRIMAEGDAAPLPAARLDRSHVYLRYSARRLDGTAIGAQRLADGTSTDAPRQLAWTELPTALALAIRQMPYNARWEIYVPAAVRRTSSAMYTGLRSTPMIFDVERLPPF